VLVLFFGGWSILAPLASAALAPGIVSPDGSRKTIGHLEGGIIRFIHVCEGDIVRAGASLVTLDNTQALARYNEIRERYLHLLAIEARLLAEQRALLRSRRATQTGREKILRQRVLQLDEQNAGLREVIAAQDRQIALIAQEIGGTQKLYERGLERLPRLLALQRAQADLDAEKATNRARIAENGQRSGETEIQILTSREQVMERTNDELAEVQQTLAELWSQMPSRQDILQRTVIRAPISGTVMSLRATTETGVVRPGEPVLELVPEDAMLIIDAHVKPTDIDRVRPGMEARVLLTAYKQRNLPRINGVLRSISADRMVDDRTGDAYFLAKVVVDTEDLALLDEVHLAPGMPADVMILNDEQTLIDYMLGPILQSMRRSFHEN
jgi:HlyD family type I secretion membrane fusion protein